MSGVVNSYVEDGNMNSKAKLFLTKQEYLHWCNGHDFRLSISEYSQLQSISEDRHANLTTASSAAVLRLVISNIWSHDIQSLNFAATFLSTASDQFGILHSKSSAAQR